MYSPKVTIITVCFNSEKTIEKTICSVLNQTYSNIEYIVKDGLSTDNTVSIVNRYKSKISCFISEKDKGIYHALNSALDKASGEIIAILHSDDFFSSDKVIEKVVQTFAESNTDAVYGNLEYVKKNEDEKVVRKWISGKYKSGDFLLGWMPPHPSFFLKKKCYDTFGKFSTQLKTAADYELMLRMIHKHKITLTYLNECLVKMRMGGNSNSSIKNRLNANLEDREAWKLNQIKPYFFTLWLKPFRKISQFF